MAARTTEPPGGGDGALRAVPTLVFEVTRIIGTLSTAAFGPGYNSTQVTLMSEGALALQRAIGTEQFTVLLVLAMSANDESGQLFVDNPTRTIAAETGWGRQKCSRMLTALEEGGFLHSKQLHGKHENGRAKFIGVRTWLASALYQTTERRLNLTPAPQVARAPISVDADRDNRSEPSVDADRVSSPSAVVERVNTHEPAGRTADAIRVSADSRHHHEDEYEDELHSSLPDDHEEPAAAVPAASSGDDLAAMRVGLPLALRTAAGAPAEVAATPVPQAASLTVEEVRRAQPQHVIELLKSWRVFNAEHLVQTTSPQLLAEAIAAVTSRFDSIEKPGAYLRQLIRAGATGSVPAPALKPSRPVAAPRTARATLASVPDAPDLPADTPPPAAVSRQALDEALDRLPPPRRAELVAQVEAELVSTSWVRGRRKGSLFDAQERLLLAKHLQTAGVLPSPTAASGA